MPIDAATLRELQADAARFGTRNHVGFLAEALSAARRPGRPDHDPVIDALAILSAMQGSSFVGSRWERAALSDVGAWLERRIGREIAITPRRLSLELGWLKRLAAFHDSQRKHRAAGGKPPDARPFGRNLDRLRARRAAPVPGAREPARPEPLSEGSLPPSLDARFESYVRAREIGRIVKRRVQRGRPPKERGLRFMPAVPALRERLPLIVGGTLSTEGADALLEAVGVHNAPFTFRVEWALRDGEPVALRVTV